MLAATRLMYVGKLHSMLFDFVYTKHTHKVIQRFKNKWLKIVS